MPEPPTSPSPSAAALDTTGLRDAVRSATLVRARPDLEGIARALRHLAA